MGELEATKVTPDTVQSTIKKLKRGKSDGEDLISDHLILAPTSFTKILASVVTPVISVMSTFSRFQKVVTRITLFPLIIKVLNWCAENFLMVLNQLYVSRFRETIHAKKTWSI